MPETLAQEQKRIKSNFEDIVATRASMDDEAKKAAYAFLDYCNAKNIAYQWSSTNRWNLRARSKIIGYICIGVRSRDDDSWRIMLDLKELLQYEDFIQKEGLTEIIHSNINYCEACNKSMCGKLRNPMITKILGKEFHNLCGVFVCFKNPTIEALDDIRKIIDFRLILSHGTASRPIIDPITEGLSRIDNKLCISAVSNLDGKTNENMGNLFNGKYNNYFYAGPYDGHMSTGSSHSILFELDEPAEFKLYGIVTGLRLDVPDKWELYGSASKDEPWVLIDSQNDFPKPVTLYTEKAFKIDAPKPYKYYHITFEGQYFVVSQVHFYI